MKRRITLVLSMLGVGAILLPGCGGGGGSAVVPPVGSDTGSITIRIDFSGAADRVIPTGTQTVFVSVTGSALPSARSATLTPANPNTTFADVPVGPKIVRADAYDGATGVTSFGNLLGSGFTEVTVLKRQTTTAEVEVNPVVMETLSLIRTENLNGATVAVLSSNLGWERFLSSDNRGLKMHGEREWDSSASIAARGMEPSRTPSALETVFEPPILVPNGLDIGETFSTISTVFVNGEDYGKMQSVVRYDGDEGVKVPAGDFSGNVPRISITYNPQGRLASTPGIFSVREQTFWFASGIGPVMVETKHLAPSPFTTINILTGQSTTPRSSRALTRSFNANVFFPLTLGAKLDYAISYSTTSVAASGW